MSTEQSNQRVRCPKCHGFLTPWGNFTYVCIGCGFGKDSAEDSPFMKGGIDR